MQRNEALNKALKNLRSNSKDIEACAVVSEDGMMIASQLAEKKEDGPVAAMCSAMMSVGTRTVRELKRGKLQQVLVKGDQGFAAITNAGPHAVLLALAGPDAKLGLVLLELSRASAEIEKILAE